jgi:protein-disulfide isomerase
MQRDFVRLVLRFCYTKWFLIRMKRLVVALLLMTVPVIAVNLAKQTSWGPLLIAPKARQLGDPKAKLVILEYSDFQCPSCAFIQGTVHQFEERYRGKIRFAYKYYPLVKIHKNAMAAARAAECAAEQDRFWPFQDELFKTQDAWKDLPEPNLYYKGIAQKAALDLPRFDACLADPSRVKIIEHDMEEAKARNVNATPTFFVGDERLVGQVFATDGARAIERALRDL